MLEKENENTEIKEMRGEKEVDLWRGTEKTHKAKGRTEFLPSICEALGSTQKNEEK